MRLWSIRQPRVAHLVRVWPPGSGRLAEGDASAWLCTVPGSGRRRLGAGSAPCALRRAVSAVRRACVLVGFLGLIS